MDSKETEKALNRLYDKYSSLKTENEQLKKEIDKLKHRHSLLHDVCIESECDRDRYHKDVVSLEEENEKLKNEIKMLKSTIARNEAYITRLTKKGKWTK